MDSTADTMLNGAKLAEALAHLPGWIVKDAKLHCEFKFHDFAHAIGFMMIAAPMIERLNHHPEWTNVYNRVTVNLTTHDAGGITQRDVDMAALLQGIAQKLK